MAFSMGAALSSGMIHRVSRPAQAAVLDCAAGLGGLLAERGVLEHDLVLAGGVGDQHRALALLDRLLGDDALLYVATGGQLELDVEQRLLEYRAKAAGTRLALERLVGDRAERVGGEDQVDVVELEEAAELTGQGITRLGQ